MTIQERIQEDLKEAIRVNDKGSKEALKVIISEFQRQKSKVLSDEKSVEILRKLKSWAEEEQSFTPDSESVYLKLVSKYIPEQVADEEIEKWINENIDLSKIKNKFAAIKPVLNHFGTSTSGNQVKSVLLNMEM